MALALVGGMDFKRVRMQPEEGQNLRGSAAKNQSNIMSLLQCQLNKETETARRPPPAREASVYEEMWLTRRKN